MNGWRVYPNNTLPRSPSAAAFVSTLSWSGLLVRAISCSSKPSVIRQSIDCVTVPSAAVAVPWQKDNCCHIVPSKRQTIIIIAYCVLCACVVAFVGESLTAEAGREAALLKLFSRPHSAIRTPVESWRSTVTVHIPPPQSVSQSIARSYTPVIVPASQPASDQSINQPASQPVNK